MLRKLFGRPRARQTPFQISEPFEQELGDHRISYKPGGSTLVVAFDNAETPRTTGYAGRTAWYQSFFAAKGYSLLGIVAREADWYRKTPVIAALQDLQRAGFFQGFRKVVFIGGSMGGFAACAFARLSPGATVIAFSPQTTLHPRTFPWGGHSPEGPRQDWSLPFSDAVAGVSTAKIAYLFYDGFDRLDHRHAARFRKVASCRCVNIPGGGHTPARLLRNLDLIGDLIEHIIETGTPPAGLATSLRQRKTQAVYWTTMINHLLNRKKAARAQAALQRVIRDFPEADVSRQISRLNRMAKPEEGVQISMKEAKPRPPISAARQSIEQRFPALKRNIFIVTYGRSGSTLLQSLVQTLPGCTMRGENHNIMESIWHAAIRSRMARSTWGKEERPGSHPWYGADRIRPALFAAGMIDSMVDNVLCPPADARYFGFKEIRYDSIGDRFPELMGFMQFHFKDPLIIFNTRNVDDVAKSSWWKEWKPEKVQNLVKTMDRRFAEYHAAHPESTFLMSYEEFSRDPLALKPLFDFLGEPFDQAQIEAVLATRLNH